MRIVAGTARGRPLSAPRGSGTRPTSEKVRGAIFNVLGQRFDGGQVLDLYAGSGALALEALSRGFSRAVCVEQDRSAAEVIRRNAARCGVADRLLVREEDALTVLGRLPLAVFALAFLDPPYAVGPEPALRRLPRVLAPGALVVAEHASRAPPPESMGSLVLADRRGYGDTGISIYRLEGATIGG